jgi:hypothetical protein
MTFESKYCPDDAEQLNREYDEHYNNYMEKWNIWNNHIEQRNDCFQKSKEIPDIKQRMEQFDKCGKMMKQPKFIEQTDFFFTKFDKSSDHESKNFKELIVNHGIIDAYYLENESYIDSFSSDKYINSCFKHVVPCPKVKLDLCRQKNKLSDYTQM